MYVLQVNDIPKHYKPGYFPRKFRLLKDAKKAAEEVIREGATMARIECPNGGELDYRPSTTKKER